MTNQVYDDKDIALAWQKLANEKFNQITIKEDTIMNAITQESKSNVAELKERLKYKMYWSVFFIGLFSVILFYKLNNPDLVLLLGIIVAAYVLGLVSMFVKFRQITTVSLEETNLLQSLKKNLKVIKTVLNLEKIWGYIVFTPMILISIFGGFVLKGRVLSDILNDPVILTTGIISVVVITPILIWVSHKMNKFAYGGMIKKLEDNIIKMETLK
jgi:hypothetical protein